MRTLIFGKGYLGTSFAASPMFGESLLSSADITDGAKVREEIRRHHPHAVINCAGKTSLEWCRDNKMKALEVNVAGPFFILQACAETSIPMVHMSSGCIYEGEGAKGRRFSEKDTPDPKCFYSKSKALAEELLMQAEYPRLLILRLRQPFSGAPDPRNLITKILSYQKLIISPNSMTYVPDLISATAFLLKNNQRGIFNVCNEGSVSPYEIALQAKKILKIWKKYTPISKDELDILDAGNNREHRVDALLNMGKLRATGFKMPKVKKRVLDALKNYKSLPE
jgi:dTDP-4-dehydrorhamnose reductase